MIFQIYDLLAPLVAKASTDRCGEGKAESRNLNMENRLPKIRHTPEEAVFIAKKHRVKLYTRCLSAKQTRICLKRPMRSEGIPR